MQSKFRVSVCIKRISFVKIVVVSRSIKPEVSLAAHRPVAESFNQKPQTYTELPYKRKQVWNDTSMNRLEGKIDMKMKDIGWDLVTNGD